MRFDNLQTGHFCVQFSLKFYLCLKMVLCRESELILLFLNSFRDRISDDFEPQITCDFDFTKAFTF